jgi:2-desacetyl-2-hydroxyethyl bacteriochlorophyllide A dehydrogenase
MGGTMKAVVFRGPHDMAVETIPVPQIGPREVLVRSMASGICHSDFDLLSGKYILPFSYPVTPGHEWAGEVVEVGSEVTNFKAGDRVVGECPYGCGECTACKSGASNYCPNANHFGFTENGAASEYFKVKARLLHQLPDGVSWEEGALVEPFTVGYYAIDVLGGTDGGQKVVVFGGGTIGACTVAAARGMGATVIGVEPIAGRRTMLKKVGADYVLDPTAPNFLSDVLALTDGIGADLVVEASGYTSAQQAILKTVRNDGRVIFTGINIGTIVPVELGLIQAKGLNIKGTVGAPNIWPRALQFLNRVKPSLKPIITHRFPLSQAEKAYQVAEDLSRSVKVLLLAEPLA